MLRDNQSTKTDLGNVLTSNATESVLFLVGKISIWGVQSKSDSNC